MEVARRTDRGRDLRINAGEAEVHRAGNRAAGQAVRLRIHVDGIRGRDVDAANLLEVADVDVVADLCPREALGEAIPAQIDENERGADRGGADRGPDGLPRDDLRRVGQ